MRDFELLQATLCFILNIVVLCYYPQYWLVLIVFIHRYFLNVFSAVYLSIKPIPEHLAKPTSTKKSYTSYSLFLVVISFLPFLYGFWQDIYFTDVNLKLSLYGLILVLITLMFQMLFVIFSKRMKIGWLESLEKEIIQNNLPAISIRAKLKDYYNFSNIDDYF